VLEHVLVCVLEHVLLVV
jgi:hypothetical protein